MSVKKVFFYAPLGNLVAGFKNGGAEAGCKKTMEILHKAGYQVIVIEKPARHSKSLSSGLMHMFNLFKIFLNVIRTLRPSQGEIFHIAGFYLNQVYFEWVLIKTARILNLKTVYEIRNGGMIEAYQNSSKSYKFFMKSILLTADTILCQGASYVNFIKNNFDRDSIYYPNYIMDNFISKNNIERQHYNEINIIYFGRVVEDKNVHFIIDVCQEIKKKNLKFNLHIIGGYQQGYFHELLSQIGKYNLQNEVIFYGRQEFKDIYTHLKNSHFFIFPSKEKREGHSNSLTEAMGCGVVPLASEAGFNENIIGNPYLVFREFDPILYANRIEEIWVSNKWKTFSKEVYDRVLNNYTESIVERSLIDAYNTLLPQ